MTLDVVNDQNEKVGTVDLRDDAVRRPRQDAT